MELQHSVVIVLYPAMQRWTIHLEGGPRRVNHAAVAIGEFIYSFGGYCTGEDYETTRPMDVHVLNTVSLRWKLLPLDAPEYANIPYQRYGHTAVAFKENAYIWGGRNDKDGACKRLFAFDSTSHKWSCPVVHGNIPGARDEEIERFSNEVHALDLNRMTWTYIRTKGDAARFRDFHTATAVGSSMFIFGGRSDEGDDIFTNNEIYCNKLQCLDTNTGLWSEPKRTAYNQLMFIMESCIFFGGYNGLHNVHFRDMFCFDPITSHWSMVKMNGEGPCARRRQCCCVIDSKVFLFGGTSPVKCELNNGRNEQDLIDHSDLHVLDFEPCLKTYCKLAVLKYKLDWSCLPGILKWELSNMTTNNSIARPLNSNG
ncbi:hypothetical protein ScPMuIL_014760 [Solemya velum]